MSKLSKYPIITELSQSSISSTLSSSRLFEQQRRLRHRRDVVFADSGAADPSQ